MGATRLVGQGFGGTCSNCGAPLEADAVFCIVCGKPVAGPGPAPMPAAAPAPMQYAGTCAQCGAPLESNAMFCTVCGATVASQPSPGGGVSQTGNCPNCGWPLDPGAMYCISCGTMVSDETSPAVSAPGAYGTASIGEQMYAGPVNVEQPAYVPPAPIPGMPIALVPAPRAIEDDDDPTVRPRLVMLTREEARTGCTKTVEIDRTTRETVEVLIPAGVDVTTKLDAQGYGNFDEMTGERGPLRLSFFIN